MTAETSNARGEWVLVPREPTEAMIDAWRDAPDIWEDAYAAMLAAAPQPPIAPDYPITATCRVCDYDYRCVPVPAKCGACGTDLPPSAPVGVEGLARLLERIRDLLASLPVDCLGSGTDASGQPYPIRDEVIHGITKALAQQPAAVDGAMVERACDAYVQIADDCMGLVRRKAMRAALTAALATKHQEPTDDR